MIFLGNLYRITNTNETDSIKSYETIVSKLGHLNKDILLTSDQNIDYLKVPDTNTKSSELLNIFTNASFLPIITKPTRITNHTH